jgi:hypothetical protein
MPNEFKTYELNEQGKGQLDRISRMYEELLAVQENLIPAGRNRSLITTKLQEAHQVFSRAISELKAYRAGDE